MSPYLSVEQLVDEVLPGYSKHAIYKLVQRREIPHYRIGRRVFFKASEVGQWLKTFHVEPYNYDGNHT